MSNPNLGTDEHEANIKTSRAAMDAEPANEPTGESIDTPVNEPENKPTNKTTEPTAPSEPTVSSTPHHPHKKHKFICVLSLITTCILLVGVSFMVGHFLAQSRNQISNNDTNNPDQPSTSTNAISSEAGTLLTDVALIPEQDELTLAFLKLHNDQQNSCYSPLSIRYALEMLREGADGDTRTQIEQLLKNVPIQRYDNITDHLALANSLWVKDGLENYINPDYTNLLQTNFDASLHTDSFTSANNINTWVKDNTLGLLDQALTDQDVAGATALLMNVLAIDMNWERQFDKELTSGQYFGEFTDQTTEDDQRTTMKVTTGSVNSNTPLYFSFANEATLFASDLKQYDDTQLQFVAIQPSDDLSDFIENLDNTKLNQLLSSLKRATAANSNYIYNFTAYIPKFKIDGGLGNLINDLQTLGITDAFDADKANFSNLTSEPGFFIDSATHKTLFDFSEEGIKAAAITTFGGKGSAGGGPIPSSMNIVVSINKPFLYLVRDVKSGNIWFTGTVYQPNLWKDDKAAYDAAWGR